MCVGVPIVCKTYSKRHFSDTIFLCLMFRFPKTGGTVQPSPYQAVEDVRKPCVDNIMYLNNVMYALKYCDCHHHMKSHSISNSTMETTTIISVKTYCKNPANCCDTVSFYLCLLRSSLSSVSEENVKLSLCKLAPNGTQICF